MHNFCNKKILSDLKFISPFIRNTSDLKLKRLFLIFKTLLYFSMQSILCIIEQSVSNSFIKWFDTGLGNLLCKRREGSYAIQMVREANKNDSAD